MCGVLCAGFKGGAGAKSNGIGYAEECAPTLSAAASGTNQSPAVIVFDTTQITSPCNRSTVAPDKPSPTLHTYGGAPVIAYNMQGFGDYREGDVASSCKMRDYKDSTDLVLCIDSDRNAYVEQHGTLRVHASGGAEELTMQHMIVRRLMPLECERLQGYPDGWTNIGEWTDSKGKRHKESADSARYKALGNSIALPPWKWVLKRICAQYERDATMGSLFDGIGGFPLIWEQINGQGSCLWASEIEEFPMAVTRRRFG